MNIHEYQAKRILSKKGANILRGKVAFTSEEVAQIYDTLNQQCIIKAQIHAGGRGKAGGIQKASSRMQAYQIAENLLGKALKTPQTKGEGKIVHKLYIEEICDIDKEFYLSLLIDRDQQALTFIVSSQGGMNIEEIAIKNPEHLLKIPIDYGVGLQKFHTRKIGFFLGLKFEYFQQLHTILNAMYCAFIEYDSQLIEINPLVLTKKGDLILLDAKMSFDDNALYRQPEIAQLKDEDEEDPYEVKARQHDLNYVKLQGNIGCIVNGAGLAMATMDSIKAYGGLPANFLDIGGSATKERVKIAFDLILSDPNVEGLLINIFGGIMRCDVIAEGIISAVHEISLNIPIVVRLQGTNMQEGKKILHESGLSIISAEDFKQASVKIIQAIGKVKS